MINEKSTKSEVLVAVKEDGQDIYCVEFCSDRLKKSDETATICLWELSSIVDNYNFEMGSGYSL